MGKETVNDREMDKKRKKSSTNDLPPTKISKEDVYNNVQNFMETEAQQRSAEMDSTLFHQTCSDLRQIFDEISDLKKENTEKAKKEINEKRIEGQLLFVVLKKLNRLDKVRIRSQRDILHKEKLRVDTNRLQLQNLLYEADHLKKEVQRCYQFKSHDEEIDLVPIEEFYEKAPSEISRPNKTKTDEHAKKIARLDWELLQRKELATLCKELQAEKEKVAQEINSKTERLNSLAPGLQALLKATRPLQESLNLNFEKEWDFQRSSRLLPRPLFLVYVNISAYAEACDKFLSVTIKGDEEDAKQQLDEHEKDELNKPENEDSENEEEQDNDQERSSKGHHHNRRLSKSAVLEKKRENLFKPHPLSVTLKLNSKTNSSSIDITLQYISVLSIVTVECKLNNLESTGVVAGDVLSPTTILNSLYPNDCGLESPNPKNKFQLEELDLPFNKFISLLDEKKLGKPYKWAQTLCGIEYISTSDMKISNELCQNSITTIVKQIRGRWNSRSELYKQIHIMETGNIDLCVSETEVITRIASTLIQWVSLTWDEYSACPATTKFIDDNVVSSEDLFFRAIITRGSAKLECYLCIPCNFPKENPVWALLLKWNGTHHSQNDSSIRDIEFWINSMKESKKSASILGRQLRRGMACLDIYLETEAHLYSPIEFTQEKTYLRSYRGRSRARPFKVVPNGGGNVFTQI